MATLQGLETLQLRRRRLLAESALNRQVLQLEASHIHIRLERFKRSWWQTGWKFGAPVAGFLLTRKFKLAKGILTKGSFALLILRKLWEVWLSRKR